MSARGSSLCWKSRRRYRPKLPCGCKSSKTLRRGKMKPKKIIFSALIVLLVISAVVGIAVSFLYHSKEFHSARSIAQQYAVQANLATNLLCVSANRSWTKRGDYNLSWFLFLPKSAIFTYLNLTNSNHFILVRYTGNCPSNTFEVGSVTNSTAKNCTVDTVIYDAKLVSPPVDGF